MGFIQSSMPNFQFELPDITPAQWMRTIKKFKPTAARGADGFCQKKPLTHVSFTCSMAASFFDEELSLKIWTGHFSCNMPCVGNRKAQWCTWAWLVSSHRAFLYHLPMLGLTAIQTALAADRKFCPLRCFRLLARERGHVIMTTNPGQCRDDTSNGSSLG